jgi:hypothetical protein
MAASVAQAAIRQNDSGSRSDKEVVVPSGPLHLECWQYGAKIIDERTLSDLRASSAQIREWLHFRRDGREAVVTMDEYTACLLTPDHGARQ